MKTKFQHANEPLRKLLRAATGCFVLLLCSMATAQTTAKWQQVIGGGGTEYGYRVRACLDQGYIVAGSSSSGGVSDGYVVRTDSFGLIMWTKYFVGNNVDVLRSIRQLPDSGYILCGFTNSAWDSARGGYDGWVIRTDKNGNQLWMNCIGTPDWDFFYDVAPLYDSTFLLVGGTYGRGNGDEDMFFVKIDGNGDTLWTRTYGGVRADEARAVVETSDSMVAACGFTFNAGDTLGDGWILRMNEINGDTAWTRTEHYYGAEDKAWGITDCPVFNRIYFCGEKLTSPGNEDPIFGAFDYLGDSLYVFNTGGSDDEIFYDIVARPDGSLATIGSNFTTGAGNGDMFLFYNYGIWNSRTYGSALLDEGYSLDLTHDNGYIACGYTDGFNSNQPNIYLVKMDTSGMSTPQGVLFIRERPIATNGSVMVFPNPSNDETSLLIDAVQEIGNDPKIEIYDIAGRNVSGEVAASWQIRSMNTVSCQLNTIALKNGAYHFTITNASGIVCNGKFVVAHQ